MNEANNYVIRILNDQYTLNSDESREHVDKSVELVNLFIREILNQNKQIEHKKAAILAALRLASHIVRLDSQIDDLKNRERLILDSLVGLEKQFTALE